MDSKVHGTKVAENDPIEFSNFWQNLKNKDAEAKQPDWSTLSRRKLKKVVCFLALVSLFWDIVNPKTNLIIDPPMNFIFKVY